MIYGMISITEEEMMRTGIVPLIESVNKKIHDLRFDPPSKKRDEAMWALAMARNYLITARAVLQQNDTQRLAG